jgi:hypothetical protein
MHSVPPGGVPIVLCCGSHPSNVRHDNRLWLIEQYEYVHIRFLRNGYGFTNYKETSYIPYLKYSRYGEVLTKYWGKDMFDEFYKIVFVFAAQGIDEHC